MRVVTDYIRRNKIKYFLIAIFLFLSFCTGILADHYLGENKYFSFSTIAKANPAKKNFEYFTLSKDTFETGTFDWFIDTKTKLAMGVPKYGPLQNIGMKLSPIDPRNPQPWNGGEYFCDPDTVIVVSNDKRYEVVYNSYLRWKKDTFIDPKQAYIKISFKHNFKSGLQQPIVDTKEDNNAPVKLDIREDHTLETGNPWVKTKVTITNRYDEKIDLLYTYQDAAYMWFPDQNQENVFPLLTDENANSFSTKYQFKKNTSGELIAGTFNSKHGVYAGLMISDSRAYLGIIPEYAFFNGHASDHPYLKNLGYANVNPARKTFSQIFSELAKNNNKEVKPGQLKNRILSLPINDLLPGQTISFEYYRIAFTSTKPLDGQAWEKEIKEVLYNRK